MLSTKFPFSISQNFRGGLFEEAWLAPANHWVRGIETYTFLRLLTLFAADHVTSNSGMYGNIFLVELKSVMGREYIFCKTTWNKRYLF